MLLSHRAAWPFHAFPELRGRLAASEFCRFALVGVVGLLVDVAIVYGLRAQLGVYCAGLVSYLAAATTTWALNRRWTFAGRGSGNGVLQWLLFLGTNALGALLNRGTFIALVCLVPACAARPALAVGAGAVAGMFANFSVSRRYVFPVRQGARP